MEDSQNKGIYKGSCLCGSVTYQVEKPFLSFKYCHCSRCRKSSGSAFAANIMVKKDQFQWTNGEDLVKRFKPETAKYFCTGFCPNCGSSMPWLTRNDKLVIISAGTLDDDPECKPENNIYWDSRAEWFTDVCNMEKTAE